ncbi:MAG: hypothetical protein JWO19_3727 [Bryobacterales bacterium]|jgi:glycosyltransferase involved in cell wall biosynthesis|nr:hypothetical protein [Bryobacterales bacterium]
MKIAQVAPLIESVPPALYGGTERVVSYLTEELVKQGHEVTLFASGDSVTSAELAACSPKALRLSPECGEPLGWHLIQMETVIQRASKFDVIHFHNDYLHFPMSKRMRTPHITTLHGRLDLPELPFVHKMFPGVPLISISNAHRLPLPDVNWRATIYHGLPEAYLQAEDEPPEYLMFLGRISPEKRVDRAIEIALAAELPLIIAAKVDTVDQQYFDQQIAPMLDHPLIKVVGEVGETEKRELFKKAYALLFPIDWPEPFGLVMVEAMACGVPVIAFPCGSVPEIVEHGKTGYIVDNIADAVAGIRAISRIKRNECRDVFRLRFTASRMAADYVREYKRLIHAANRPTEDLELTEA